MKRRIILVVGTVAGHDVPHSTAQPSCHISALHYLFAPLYDQNKLHLSWTARHRDDIGNVLTAFMLFIEKDVEQKGAKEPRLRRQKS